ncbi:MAG: hypothetical protein HY268_11010 [Deltaproteobacteria bacterium]|nr:hypothetical protein [Deltaproteobacteria bacterium]
MMRMYHFCWVLAVGSLWMVSAAAAAEWTKADARSLHDLQLMSEDEMAEETQAACLYATTFEGMIGSPSMLLNVSDAKQYLDTIELVARQKRDGSEAWFAADITKAVADRSKHRCRLVFEEAVRRQKATQALQ